VLFEQKHERVGQEYEEPEDLEGEEKKAPLKLECREQPHMR
jgi:hypothetical protein